jgi:hypothetical protein
VRRGLGTVTAAVIVFLGFAYWETRDSMYLPRHHLLEWTFFAAATYVFGSYRVARIADRAGLVRMLCVQGGLLFTAVLVSAIYHVYHGTGPQPEVQDWDSLRSVTPFHEQLAVPVFLGLVIAPLLAVIALETDRHAVRAQQL